MNIKPAVPNQTQIRILRIIVFAYGTAAAAIFISFVVFPGLPKWSWLSRLINQAGENGLVFIVAGAGAVFSGMLASLLNRQHILGWAVAAVIPPFIFPMVLAFMRFRYSEKNIKQLGEAEDMQGLLHALNHSENTYSVRMEMAKLATKNEAAMEKLIGALSDPSAKIRQLAIAAMAETKSAKAVSALREALHDKDEDVAITAAHNLKQISVNDAYAAMSELVEKSPSRSLKNTAIKLLGEIGNHGAIGPLTQTLAKADDNQMIAVEALGKLRATEAAEAIGRLFTSSKKDCDRITVVEALCRIGDGKGIAVLLEALENHREKLRLVIIDCLGRERIKQAVPTLSRRRDDHDSLIRSKTMEALGKIGDPAAIPILEQALIDPRYQVRNKAREALQIIAGTKA